MKSFDRVIAKDIFGHIQDIEFVLDEFADMFTVVKNCCARISIRDFALSVESKIDFFAVDICPVDCCIVNNFH